MASVEADVARVVEMLREVGSSISMTAEQRGRQHTAVAA
jgi:hypothetical protein